MHLTPQHRVRMDVLARPWSAELPPVPNAFGTRTISRRTFSGAFQ